MLDVIHAAVTDFNGVAVEDFSEFMIFVEVFVYKTKESVSDELIQNADDARATEVKLLLDTSQHGTDTLLTPSLADYQGAALYCYNDGVFTPEDWKGIQAVQQSVKKDDPMRVGRFGLGFVSVYHITDLPTIMSADKIAFLDPFERHFRDSNTRTGKAIRLDHEIMTRYKDQFSPFTNVLGIGEEHFANKNFKGTLFRFPLRQTPSPELSSTVFTPERVQELYQSFQEDGDVVLLFLNHVRRVSLYERTRSGEEKLIFEVTKTEEDMDSKMKFLEDLKSKRNPSPYFSNRSILTSVLEGQMIKPMKRNWLVLNNVFVVSGRLKELAEELKLLPWIGLAMPREEKVLQNINGRIFCFLPLPPSKESTTGLPIHVHGYFGLSDNRRSLKWPAADQKHDHTAEWNQCLVEELLPQAYSMLIVHAVQQSVPPNDVYKAWPTTERLEPHWKDFIMPFIEKVFKEEVLFTKAYGGRWLSLEKVLLEMMSKDSGYLISQRRTVTEYLIACEEPVVSVPDNVLHCIPKDARNRKEVTPAILRNCLRVNNVVNHTEEEKNLLLEYCLQDRDFSDLQGVPLLPIQECTTTTFSVKDGVPPVLFPTSKNPKILIPGTSDAFDFVDSNLPNSLNAKLRFVAASTMTQLKEMSLEDVVHFLPKVLPGEWFEANTCIVKWTPDVNGHPSEEWLSEFWKWLEDNFPTDIESFHGLPIIPVSDSHDGMKLLKLDETTPAIHAFNFKEELRECLEKLGVILLTSHMPFLSHPQLERYVHAETPEGIMSVLMKIHHSKLVELGKASKEQLASFRHSVSQLNNISHTDRDVLCQIPIFEIVPGSGDVKEFIATSLGKNDCRKPVAPLQMTNQFPSGVRLKQVFVNGDDTDSQRLLTLLGARPARLSEVVTSFILPEIKAGFYKSDEVDVIMMWLLKHYNTLCDEDSGLPNSLKDLPFIKISDSTRVAPNMVFDPDNTVLNDLFDGENVFPISPYDDSDILMVLRKLGLRKEADVKSYDLLKTATVLSITATGGRANVGKARALLDFINAHISLLSDNIEGKPLVQHLNNIEWIPRLCNKPDNYPTIVPWYQDDAHLYRPSDIYPLEYASLVGAVKPIFECKLSGDLSRYLNFAQAPFVEILLHQLSEIVNSWNTANDDGRTVYDYQTKIEENVHVLYCQLDKQYKMSNPEERIHITTQISRLGFSWIWNGNNFILPKNVAIKTRFTFDVKPHLFELPQRLHHFAEFFQACGVREEFGDSEMVSILEMMKANMGTTKTSDEFHRDIQLCINILEWMTRNGEEVTDNIKGKLLVPIQTESDSLELSYTDECTYCDNDALLEEEGLSDMLEGEDNCIRLVHERIAKRTAKLLGIVPLSQRLAQPDPLGFEFEQTGPYEPLTTRLRNILSDYSEGVSIFKELIQNADDAGATEVKFLIDWRSNRDYQRRLFSKEMQTCQGPALWAYNNAVFTDDDLININRLAGATKLAEKNKIGRFGLGFNSVYHLTDVPSFISRHFFVMFDPHTTHIPNLIKDKAKPGIKLNLRNNPKVLRMYSDQFKTYTGIFGCDVMNGSDFNATLFRFPLRSEVDTKRSEISDTVYTKERMEELISKLKEHAHSLLIFTQNVKSVSVFQKTDDYEEPLFKTDLTHIKILYTESEGILAGMRQILKAGTTFLEKVHSQKRVQPPLSVYIAKSSSVTYRHKKQHSYDEQVWAISSCVSNGEALQLALKDTGQRNGLVPCGSVAVKLSCCVSSYSLMTTKGEAFCYLPLHVTTNLPVHINGGFSVDSSRRDIKKHVSSDLNKSEEVEWNEVLMQDVISKAYVCLLEQLLVSEVLVDNMDIYSLWPRTSKTDGSSFANVTSGFYQRVIANSKKKSIPKLLVQEPYIAGEHFLSFNSARLLAPVVKDENEQLANYGRTILNSYFVDHKTSNRTTNLPDDILQSLVNLGFHDVITEVTVTEELFYREHVFPFLMELECGIRDMFIIHILTTKRLRTQQYMQMLFKEYPSIPTSPNGMKLSRPSDLVDPTATILANLFDDEDGRFPYGVKYRQTNILAKLSSSSLGMARTRLEWSDVLERARSIQPLYESAKLAALQRAKYLIQYLNDLHTTYEECRESSICKIEFLPVEKKHKQHKFPWFKASKHILAPCELYTSKHRNLVGTLKPILNEDPPEKGGCGVLPLDVGNFLGLDKAPDINIVIEQLFNIVGSHNVSGKSGVTNDVCCSIYHFMQEKIISCKYSDGIHREENVKCKEALEKLTECQKPFLLADGAFVYPHQLCFQWELNYAPYLYRMPDLMKSFTPLLKACGVKDQFEKQDFAIAIRKLASEKNGSRLKKSELRMVCDLLLNFTIARGDHDEIFIPDTECLLQYPNQLAYNDAPWIETRVQDLKFTHSSISRHQALTLGIKLLRSKQLDSYSSSEEEFFIGEEFGQSERLTDRLKGILRDFPSGIEILKELVQNADDAQATEMHFIYDKRTHDSKRVFNYAWKDLQGPALCVYNNKPFSEKDIEGIKRLGVGGKRDSFQATGQYGIGFNAVYHLTDCPSFITGDADLVVLDPHAKYVPGANRQHPGRRINVKQLQRDFPDIVFPYLGNIKQLKGATIFRLPLRTSCQTSEISDRVFDEQNMVQLLKSFQEEMQHILLFLNHIQVISISEISKCGRMENVFSVTAAMDDYSRQERTRFTQEVISHATLIKDDCLSIWNIPETSATFCLNIQDSNMKESQWLVTQKLGFSSKAKEEIPSSHFEDLVKFILPKGGVAMLLHTFLGAELNSQMTSRAFCFLPLPINTRLPFCVNGHFALGTDRRHLWQEGGREKWNDCIKEHVIAPTVIRNLEALKHKIERSGGATANLMHIYMSMFPNLEEVHTDWKGLAQYVYRLIYSADVELLPVIRPTSELRDVKTCRISQKKTLQWFFAKDVFFDTLQGEADNKDDDVESLQFILREIGFPITALPLMVSWQFNSSSTQSEVCQVKCTTPGDVMHYMSRHNSNGCIIGKVPCKVQHSTFHSSSRVLKVLNYCLESDWKTLHDIPLCITEDNTLKIYDNANPVYVSMFASLIPRLKHRFVHGHLISVLQKKVTSSCTLKYFTLDDLNSNMVLPHGWQNSTKYVKWEPRKNHQPSMIWLKTLWNFVHSRICVHGESIKALMGWPVIPITKNYLVPFPLGKTVLGQCPNVTGSVRSTLQILQNLKCPEVDYKALTSKHLKCSDAHQLLQGHVADPNSRTDVLQVLFHHVDTQEWGNSPTDDECYILLKYFQEDISEIHGSLENLRKLKSLPVYATIFNTLTPIKEGGMCHVLSSGIPNVDRDIWIGKSKCTFLKEQPCLSELYGMLDANSITSCDVYVKYIFPCFGEFSNEGRLQHLQFIRDELLPSQDSGIDNLRSKLQQLKFIPGTIGEEELFCANHFYDPKEPIFTEFLSIDSFPASPYDKEEWLPFLTICGLKEKVDDKQFLRFAKEVEDRKVSDKVWTGSQAKILIDYLMEQPHLHDDIFLNQISKVEFIPTYNPEKYLLDICPTQYKTVKGFSSYSQAVPCSNSKLIWTTTPMLPEWANPEARCEISTKKKLSLGLKIQPKPCLDAVLEHCTNLSKVVTQRNTTEVGNSAELLCDVMAKIYDYIMESCTLHAQNTTMYCGQRPGTICANCTKVHEELKHIAVVVVEEGQSIVKACQIYLHNSLSNPLEPYLYLIPLKIGPYKDLFQLLGAQERPSSTQFAIALEEIHVQNVSNHLSENDLLKAKQAMKGLFISLDNQCSLETTPYPPGKVGCVPSISSLYLLSSDKELHPSTQLVFNDIHCETRRLEDLKDPFLIDLYTCDLSIYPKRLVEHLPEHFKPKYLSSMVSEKMVKASYCEEYPVCSFQEDFIWLFSSEGFTNAIRRLLVKHDKVLTDGLEKLVKNLKKIGIRCVSSVQVHLVNVHNQAAIPNSERTLPLYLIEDGSQYILNIHHNSCMEGGKIYMEMTRAVCEVLQGMADKIKLEIAHLLQCKSVDEMNAFLREEGCLDSNSSQYASNQVPVIGTRILQDRLLFLDQDPDYYFCRDEYVGYILDDDHEELVYIYAKIVKEVKLYDSQVDKSGHNYQRMYEIDIGKDENIVISTLEIYNITSVLKCNSLVPYEGALSSSFKGRDLDEVLDEVSNLLEAIWFDNSLSEEQRRRAIKRLYLKWHPDKNPGDELFVTEVFKHLKAELERLKDGRPRSKRLKRDSSGRYRPRHFRTSEHGRQTSYSKHYGSWDDEANTYKQRWSARGSSSSSSHKSFSQSPRIPNKREGQRWFRQARADLRSATNDVHREGCSYEWVGFKCQQATEKSLKVPP
ncbi:sacsin-like [Glandiceps talaboti]